MANATKAKPVETAPQTPEVEAILAHTQKTEDANWETPAPLPADTSEPTTADTSEPTTADCPDGNGNVEEVKPLVGQELLNLVQSCGDNIPRDELIRLAGYTKTTKDGTTRLMNAAFMEAILEAKGVKMGIEPSAAPGERGKMGHPLSYVTRIHFNGNIMVGKAYVSILDDHEKGKPFKVVVNPDTNPGGINLIPVSPEEGSGTDTEE